MDIHRTACIELFCIVLTKCCSLYLVWNTKTFGIILNHNVFKSPFLYCVFNIFVSVASDQVIFVNFVIVSPKQQVLSSRYFLLRFSIFVTFKSTSGDSLLHYFFLVAEWNLVLLICSLLSFLMLICFVRCWATPILSKLFLCCYMLNHPCILGKIWRVP